MSTSLVIISLNKFTLFLVDYLSIYDEVIRIYKSIKGKKMLVITKSDLIYKNTDNINNNT